MNKAIHLIICCFLICRISVNSQDLYVAGNAFTGTGYSLGQFEFTYSSAATGPATLIFGSNTGSFEVCIPAGVPVGNFVLHYFQSIIPLYTLFDTRTAFIYSFNMHTIQNVLTELEHIIADCRDRNSAMGYFAALYYSMTNAVAQGIQSGAFEDGDRMEKLDILFAQRYIDAYTARQSGLSTTRSWQAAFDAAEADGISVLQHLLLGINAHINLDLGIAAAQTCPGNAIWALESDFTTINTLISNLTEQVQQRLSGICPPLGFLDMALKTQDEGIADFSILVARKTAWHAAMGLAFLEGNPRTLFIEGIDEGVAGFAQRIHTPKGWILRSALRVIQGSEQGNVTDKIDYILGAPTYS